MTTLFLMKIGKEYFFKLVRYFFLNQYSGSAAVDRIITGQLECWLTLPFFVFPTDRPINFPEKV